MPLCFPDADAPVYQRPAVALPAAASIMPLMPRPMVRHLHVEFRLRYQPLHATSAVRNPAA